MTDGDFFSYDVGKENFIYSNVPRHVTRTGEQGLPDTVVPGPFHQWNVRDVQYDGTRLVVG